MSDDDKLSANRKMSHSPQENEEKEFEAWYKKPPASQWGRPYKESSRAVWLAARKGMISRQVVEKAIDEMKRTTEKNSKNVMLVEVVNIIDSVRFAKLIHDKTLDELKRNLGLEE